FRLKMLSPLPGLILKKLKYCINSNDVSFKSHKEQGLSPQSYAETRPKIKSVKIMPKNKGFDILMLVFRFLQINAKYDRIYIDVY
ncbi:hypothetical protein, partial [Treponema sp. R8-4-B8]